MVNSRSQQLDETFFALSDPTRRAMLTRLAEGHTSVAELSAPFDISAPAVSRHLKVLERAGLLTRQGAGRSRTCQLQAGPLHEAAAWVTRYRQFWEQQLDQFVDWVEQQAQKETDG